MVLIIDYYTPEDNSKSENAFVRYAMIWNNAYILRKSCVIAMKNG
jgi:hypothetical protein